VRDRLDEGDSTHDGEGDVDEMLASRQPAAGSTFDFVHVEEPHYPWTHYPSGLRYSEETEDFRAFFNETEWLDDTYVTDRARQSHLLEVGFADHLLGRVIDRLKEDGLWEETMLVVVADHGGAMTKGLHRREGTPETMGQIAMVPLFVKAPGQTFGQGKTIDQTTCITEIVPMMAGHLGIDLPWDSPDCDRSRVTIDNGTGPTVSSPVDTVLEQRDEYIGTLTSLFGGDTGWPRVLELGPHKNLIGTRLRDLNVKPPEPGISAAPEVTGTLATDLQPEIPLNPVLRQRGELTGVEPDTPLAVAVNGKVVAVGRAYQEVSRILYSILLPETSLRAGRNRIQVLKAGSAGGDPERTSLTELWSSDNQ